mgnify:CR=1 FL=1
MGPSSLREIITHLKKIYCESIGVEYMFIRKPEEIQWIQNKLNINDNHPKFTADRKKYILRKLNEAVSFETFLHTKYVGQKRFSLEGGESFIPALDAIIEAAASFGVKEFVMGMAHRGRLNTLTNIFGKNAKDIFSEFDGKDYDQEVFDGDVKYHLGWTSCRTTDSGKEINLNIAPNPSHLETVGAVVEGIARAKQDKHHFDNPNQVLPIVVHGDAAIAGQGIVYEIVQMAQLDGYTTKGTIHIVINNQIGFTTNYLDARSSTYCTDVAKTTLSPVLHVNADDVEAVVHAALFALDFRMEFGRDVFIDLLGYRKYGHNEGDEPSFTQPMMYKKIRQHPTTLNIYGEKLIKEGTITAEEFNKNKKEFKNLLDEQLKTAKEYKPKLEWFEGVWSRYKPIRGQDKRGVTGVTVDTIKRIGKRITHIPEDFNAHPTIRKIFDNKKKMFENGIGFDFATAAPEDVGVVDLARTRLAATWIVSHLEVGDVVPGCIHVINEVSLGGLLVVEVLQDHA